MSSFAALFAQVATNAAALTTGTTGADSTTPGVAPAQAPWWTNMFFPVLIFGMIYFVMIRPQAQAKKKAEETVKAAKTGDKIVTTSGIHGLITNVKDSTVIVKVADNVKLEIEKSHIDRVVREADADAGKAVATKA